MINNFFGGGITESFAPAVPTTLSPARLVAIEGQAPFWAMADTADLPVFTG